MEGARVTIRERSHEDDPQIVEIFNANRPDRSPVSVEVYRHSLATTPEAAGFRAMVAAHDGQVIALAEWNRRLYTVETDSYHLELTVHPAHWETAWAAGSTIWRWNIIRSTDSSSPAKWKR